jgi:hypothetical protein
VEGRQASSSSASAASSPSRGGRPTARPPALQAFDLDPARNAGVALRTEGVQYYGLEVLDITFGTGASMTTPPAHVLNVQGTGATSRTDIRLGAGDDRIFVSSLADFRPGGPYTDFLRGHLNDFHGTLNIDAGAGRHLLLISDEASTTGKDAVITSVRNRAISKDGRPGADGELATNAQIYVVGLAGRGITYRTDGTFADGVTYWAGHGNDVLAIDATHEALGVRTVTSLNTGLGNDVVTVDLKAGQDGFFVLNTQGAYQQVITVPDGSGGAPSAGTDTRPADSIGPATIGGQALLPGQAVLHPSYGVLLTVSPRYVNGVLQPTSVTLHRTLVAHGFVTTATRSVPGERSAVVGHGDRAPQRRAARRRQLPGRRRHGDASGPW